MDSLDLLWKLESHNSILRRSRAELEKLKDNSNIIILEERQKSIENRYEKQRQRLDEIIEKIRKAENLLKSHEFKHKEKKRLLYKGNIVDISQLEQLDREEKQIKSNIDSMESEIIRSLQEVDLMKEELSKMKIETDLTRELIETQKKEIKKRIIDLEGIIFREIDYITFISSEIDENILNIYEKISKQKLDAIVAVKEDICMGCNMRISNYQKKSLAEGVEIIICESCGRILYIENEESLSL